MDDTQLMRALVLDDSYHVVRVLAEGPSGRTELVTLSGEDDDLLVRKRIPKELANTRAWASVVGIDDPLVPHVENIYRMPDELVVIYGYVEGTSLYSAITREGAFDVERAVGVVGDVCHAASVLHGVGVIHRDITPGNVILSLDGAHLVDLGIARVAESGRAHDTTTLGTWGFIAPEQLGYAQTDARSDVFSIGRLLGYMLTGFEPDKASYEILMQDDLCVPSGLRSVIDRACAMEPSMRYQTAEELADAVRAAITGEKSPAEMPKTQVKPRTTESPTQIFAGPGKTGDRSPADSAFQQSGTGMTPGTAGPYGAYEAAGVGPTSAGADARETGDGDARRVWNGAQTDARGASAQSGHAGEVDWQWVPSAGGAGPNGMSSPPSGGSVWRQPPTGNMGTGQQDGSFPDPHRTGSSGNAGPSAGPASAGGSSAWRQGAPGNNGPWQQGPAGGAAAGRQGSATSDGSWQRQPSGSAPVGQQGQMGNPATGQRQPMGNPATGQRQPMGNPVAGQQGPANGNGSWQQQPMGSGRGTIPGPAGGSSAWRQGPTSGTGSWQQTGNVGKSPRPDASAVSGRSFERRGEPTGSAETGPHDWAGEGQGIQAALRSWWALPTTSKVMDCAVWFYTVLGVIVFVNNNSPNKQGSELVAYIAMDAWAIVWTVYTAVRSHLRTMEERTYHWQRVPLGLAKWFAILFLGLFIISFIRAALFPSPQV